MILVVKNTCIEGPGLIGEYFKEKKVPIKTIELERGDRLPEDISQMKGVVILGGPMNVYEEEKYPFLAKECKFIKNVLEREIPYLGICLGAQLLARSSGALIRKAPEEEIGYFQVELTDEGDKDVLFRGLDRKFNVFQWHADTFDVPPEGVLLAVSKGCHNQAFRVGKNAYGTQFHLEVTAEIVKEWIEEYLDPQQQRRDIRKQEVMKREKAFRKNMEINARRICANFESIIADKA